MRNLEDILVDPDIPLSEAIKVLDQGGVRIILVVDNEKRLLGTITDGDIRRALLKRHDLNCSISEVMNKNPVSASQSDDREYVLSLMRKKDLVALPILRYDKKVIDIEILSQLLSTRKHDNPVFLMAGGFGKRLSPLTDDIPKPLLNIGSKPILETILLRFVDSGFHDFYISTHYKAELVMEHFGDGSKWDIEIKYIHEKVPLGTAGALGLLPQVTSNSELPIVVMNADIMTKVNFEDLIKFHVDQGSKATICSCEYSMQMPYANLEIEGDRVVRITEKPKQTYFINAGIYVLNRDLLTQINQSKYLDMPNLIENIINSGHKVTAFPLHEYWVDIGDMAAYHAADKKYKDEFPS